MRLLWQVLLLSCEETPTKNQVQGAMAAASEDPKFREELGTIEQCTLLFPSLHPTAHHPTGFKLLSESEQTATLYTLLQHANQGQVKFMSAVLHQMSADIQPAPGMFPYLLHMIFSHSAIS